MGLRVRYYFESILSWVIITYLKKKGATIGEGVRFRGFPRLRLTDFPLLTIGEGTEIDEDVLIWQGGQSPIHIGRNCYIGIGTIINSSAGMMLEIGDNTLVGAYCVVQNNNHGINRGKLIRLQDNVGKPLVIGRDCWLGAHVCVLGGASIGDGAVVGAQSLVNRPVEPFTVVGGVPARVLKLRG